MTTTFNTINDLLRGDTPYQFARGLYNAVGCGPWTTFLVERASVSARVVTIEIREKAGRLHAKADTTTRCKEHCNAIAFLGFNDDGTPHKNWRSLKSYARMVRRFFAKHPTHNPSLVGVRECIGCLRVDLRFSVPADIEEIYYDRAPNRLPGKCIGIKIGSIVEGSDVEVGPVELRFPFTEEEFDRALKDIDEEAHFYWQRDNSTYYSVRDKKGNVVCWAHWTEFDDDPTVTDPKHKSLARRAYEALFPSTENSWSAQPGREAPIPRSRYVARLEETPNITY